MRIKNAVTALGVGGLVALASIGSRGQAPSHGEMTAAPTVTKAIALLHHTAKGSSEISGTVTFTKVGRGLQVQAEIRGLAPGKHGFHIHEFGDCSSPDAMSAGAHFNPGMMPHAGPMSTKRHVGDLGNIEADSSGRARYDVIDPAMSFYGPNSILGRSVIVHEKADDLRSQPAGDAGARIACGVIGVAKGR
jgi:Cu-Zn family superoxide dismutase